MSEQNMEPDSSSSTGLIPEARGYQQEMLEESLKRNLIVALDTGSGKTLIAILRIKSFLEVGSKKVAWFFAPTVVLCEQQRDVISHALPVKVGLISGALEPNQWKDQTLWRRVLEDHRVVVSTPQVLLDALRHGYVNLGTEIGLLVFDEAHHVADNHPYNRIMAEFYQRLPPRPAGGDTVDPSNMRPMVLGLTASPSFGGNVARAFRIIEANLDSVIRAPVLYREELKNFVHRPVFKHVMYKAPPYYYGDSFPSGNLAALKLVFSEMDINNDPYVISLRDQLKRLPPGSERSRVDQKLSKTVNKKDSYTHKGLRDFERAAEEICIDLGPWAADWFVSTVVERARTKASPYRNIISQWQQKEKNYLLNALTRMQVTAPSYDPETIIQGTSSKAHELIRCLLDEKTHVESQGEDYSCLVFVTRRDTVIALAEILCRHPATAGVFRVGCLLGSSDSMYRRSFLDITRELLTQKQSDTLMDFRIGEKNLIVSTAVAEEGIDIQACGTVVRWDRPQNMVSWAQSRGRARRKSSSFVLMFEDGGIDAMEAAKFMSLEQEMVALYYAERERASKLMSEEIFDDEDSSTEFHVESTGALLTPQSAIGHLEHFCAVLPNGNHAPIYEIDPPTFPEGWHSLESNVQDPPAYPGPFGATVILPRLVPAHLRAVTVPKEYKNKQSARSHAAFKAYIALYHAGLLNDHLLPLTSVIEPDLEEEVKAMLKDVEKRDGTASVSSQMNPWKLGESDSTEWRCTELVIGGLPKLRMFTLVNPLLSPDNLSFALYPGDADPIQVTLQPAPLVRPTDDDVERARDYTRRMFWGIYGSRMHWDDTDFTHLFLPLHPETEGLWDARRAWWKGVLTDDLEKHPDNILMADAKVFGERFGWTDDLSLVVAAGRAGKSYRFVRWRSEQLTTEEEEAAIEWHKNNPMFQASYPLLVAEALPRRVHLLLSQQEPTLQRVEPQLLLSPAQAKLILSSPIEFDYAFALPSILRHLTMSMTLHSLRGTLLSGTALYDLPSSLLMTAISAPVAQEQTNYQRLETLGDTALKFIVSHQLLAEYPLWHEGYLSKKKDHMVNNAQLAKEAVGKHLYRWIIRDKFAPRKWVPSSRRPVAALAVSEETGGTAETATEAISLDPKKKPKPKQALSTKVLADVVESLLGAAYISGGFNLTIEGAKLFGLGFSSWKTIETRVEEILERTEVLEDLPTQVSIVERILGYTFARKGLVVEALTHSSHQSMLRTMSYERMEFLGDCVLDMIVTDYLYHAPGKNYSPGHMHLRKSAVVNAHFLAFICLRASVVVDSHMPQADHQGRIVMEENRQELCLWQCLLHSSPRVLDDQMDSAARFKRQKASIERALEHSDTFPWATLTRLQAPKFFSDMIESLIGAVYLDSGGNLDVVRSLLRTLGILPVLERIVDQGVEVQHPVSQLSIWAAKHHKKVEYEFTRGRGKVTCAVLIDGQVEAQESKSYRGRVSDNEVRFTVAEKAVKLLKIETVYELLDQMLLDLEDDESDDEDDDD